MRPITALLAISLVAVLPGAAHGQSDPDPLGVVLSAGASDHVFELEISAPATWTAGEPIEVGGTLAYVGTEPTMTVTGSGLVFWGAEQLDGPVHAEPGWRPVARQYDFEVGDVETYTFTKSGGYDASGPDAAFWSAWFDDPELRLPAGTWRIYALARYRLPGASGETELVADVEIEVMDDETASGTDWGPLAVLPEGGAGDAGFGPGILSIGEDCVTLTSSTGENATTLVWPADTTIWRPENQRIVIEQRRYGTTRLSDGDRVMIGGVPLVADTPEYEERLRAWLEASWVQPPRPSCPAELFHVGEVRKLE
jgi:hypothetical protein